MSDRSAEWASCRSFNIDVDPLVISSRLGEEIHLFLGDVDIRAVAEVFADQALEFVGAVDGTWAHPHSMPECDLGRRGDGRGGSTLWCLYLWGMEPMGNEQQVEQRSGLVAMVGRPNVGKSSLVNAICGRKVSIVSDKPQTTRHRVMGVLDREGVQVVFVDTPGLHKPVSALGERVNATALESSGDVDLQCLVLDATKPYGRGDQWVADRMDPSRMIVVVNKVDIAGRDRVMAMLAASGELDARAYFPVSARTQDGVPALVEHLTALMPIGPRWFSDGETNDMPPERWVAELVREQLLAVVHDELPYSIATRVTDWEWPRIRCEILVERESQKGMVIGRGGLVLREVGRLVREQLPEGAFIELRVRVDKDWQRRPDRVERLGY